MTPFGRFLEAVVNRSKLLRVAMLVIMAALVVADILIPSGYDRFFWESLSGAGAFYGIFSCWLIVVVSKFLGSKFLSRKEDYFDNETRPSNLIGDPATREKAAPHD